MYLNAGQEVHLLCPSPTPRLWVNLSGVALASRSGLFMERVPFSLLFLHFLATNAGCLSTSGVHVGGVRMLERGTQGAARMMVLTEPCGPGPDGELAAEGSA